MRRSVNAAMAAINAHILALTSVLLVIETGMEAPVSGDDLARWKKANAK